MPHILLEYTENIKLDGDFRDLFKQIHHILNKKTGIRLENCKSRAVKQEAYYIGDGDPQHAFAHLNVRFLEGRTEDIKQLTGKALLDYLKTYFDAFASELKIQITVEIRDIRKNAYFKYPDNL